MALCRPEVISAYPISPQTLNPEPRYLLALTPVLVLLLAQLAASYAQAAAVIAVALVVSVVTLHRMDTYRRTVPPQPPIAPRDLGPLVATLDGLGLDRVYATFWLAYRLDFDTRERIIAAQSKLLEVAFAGGQAVPPHNPTIRYEPYERKVQAACHGFVFFRAAVGEVTTTIAQLERHGYRRVVTGPFVVYAPSASISPSCRR